MADSREFVLIGRFDDHITPVLEKINNSLSGLKKNLNAFSSRKSSGFGDITKSVGSLVSSHKHLADSIKEVRKELTATVPVLKEYRKEVGKAAAANIAIGRSGSRIGQNEAKFWKQATANAQQYNRTISSIGAQTGRRMPGGGAVPLRAARQSNYGGGQPGRGYVARDATYAFSQTLGYSLSNIITGAITEGFQIGVGLMMKPFEYFANAFGERVQDQLSDLKAAGGLFSISKRMEESQKGSGFLRDIDQAIQYQQDTNRVFAKMAAALPGVTNDYVQVGKRLSDTAARIVSTDFAKAQQEANKIRATEEGRKFYGQAITGAGPEAKREIITTLLGELTKKTTLAGLGGRSGAGGVKGAYGLPGLTERMISQDVVSVGQFQRYAAVFSDPTILDALTRNIDKINATQKNSIARYQALNKLLDEVVTPDLIDKLRVSVDGIYQGLRSAILDPDTGLFGLGRQFNKLGRRMNSYGQYIDEFGKVVEDASKAAYDDLSIFEEISQIFANVGQALMPIVEAMPYIFDPLKAVAKQLDTIRHYTGQFSASFTAYREGFQKLAQMPGMDFLKGTIDIRASFAAINNLLRQFGVYGDADFAKIAKELESKDLDIGAMLSSLIKKLLDSDVAKEIGKAVGELVGTVISEVAKMLGAITGVVEGGPLIQGLTEGFKKAGGPQAIQSIFQNLFKLIFKAFTWIFSQAPLEFSILGAAALLIPAFAAGLSVAVGAFIERYLDKALMGVKGGLARTAMPRAAAAGAAGMGGRALDMASIGAAFIPGGRGKAIMRARNINRIRRQKDLIARAKAPFQKAYTEPIGPVMAGFQRPGGRAIMPGKPTKMLKALNGLQKFGTAAGKVAKGLPGLSIAFGALDFTARKLAGESTTVAAGGAIGATAGGTIGAVLGSALGPVGTVGGGILGSFLGDWLGTNLGKAIEALPGYLSGLPAQLSSAFDGIKNWFINLPMNVGYAIGSAVAQLEMAWQRFSRWWVSLGPLFDSAINNAIVVLRGIWNKFTTTLRQVFTGKFDWESLARSLSGVIWNIIKSGIEGVKNFAAGIGNWFQGFGKGFQSGYQETKAGYTSTATQQRQKTTTVSPIFSRAKGGLGDAIASEMKHKPSNSNLVIANTSETVIPAAGGYGMKAFMGSITDGFLAVKNQLQTLGVAIGDSNKASAARDQQTNSEITDYHNQTQQQILQLNQNLSSLATQVSSLGAMGGMGGFGGGALFGAGGGGVGKVVAVGKMLQGMGLHVAENPYFGTGRVGKHAPGSYHYSGRAIDVTGSDAQLDAAYSKLRAMGGYSELLWRTAGHYDHLHVAYALGQGNPAFFSSQSAAEQWERSMIPGSAKVASITSNSREMGAGNTFGDINVTVNAGNISDPDELASIVALKIGDAVTEARLATMFV